MNEGFYISRAIRCGVITLLQMEFTPSELAEDLDINRREVYRQYIPAGMLHRKDRHNNRVLAIGNVFHGLADNLTIPNQQGVGVKSKLNDGFCLSYLKRVPLAGKVVN